MFNKIKEIYKQHDFNKLFNNYNNLEDNRRFIWGIKAYDDLSNSEANLYTMNDIDIIYDIDVNKYFLSIETIYNFQSETYTSKDYICNLFNQMTKWMTDSNYKLDYELNLYDVFTMGIDLHKGFDSIKELYAAFKLLVNGFCGDMK